MTDKDVEDVFASYGQFVTGKDYALVRAIAAAIAPQRTWVGLTDEEAIDIGTQCQWYDGDCERFDSIGFARAIEVKLKQKNS